MKWTHKTISKEALKYKTRSEFMYASKGAYNAAKRLNIFKEVCSHMPEPKRWTIEELQAEALKYNSRTEFNNENHCAYCVAQKKGKLNAICKHMDSDIVKWRRAFE